MLYFLILMSAIFVNAVNSIRIHEDERKPKAVSCIYPQVADADPQYSIVPITNTISHDDPHFQELSFHLKDKHVQVNLTPNEGVLIHKRTPVWKVKRVNNKVQFIEQRNALRDIEVYTDESTNSSFVQIPEKDGYFYYYGIYNYDIGVKAAPKQHTRRRREVTKNKTVSTMDHVVYTMPKRVDENTTKLFPILSTIDKMFASELPPPKTVYPQILVVMDHKLYSHYNGSLQDALGYIITFWNAVDLKYRELKSPEVRLNIAGIAIEEGPGILLNNSRILEEGQFKGKVNGRLILEDFGFYLYNSHLQIGKDYDLALYMMGNDIIDTQMKAVKKHALNGLLGLAKVGSACMANDSARMIDAVGAFEDTNGYIGLLHATHELAHLLGAIHDGDKGSPAAGIPGAERCSSTIKTDYIMSTTRSNGKQFSDCSKEAMRVFFQRKNAECLRNTPLIIGKTLSSITLPGKRLSLDEQCISAGFLGAYYNGRSVCDNLYCIIKKDKDSTEYVTILPGAEGSICDWGYHCIQGQCVKNEKAKGNRNYKYVDRNSNPILQ